MKCKYCGQEVWKIINRGTTEIIVDASSENQGFNYDESRWETQVWHSCSFKDVKKKQGIKEELKR